MFNGNLLKEEYDYNLLRIFWGLQVAVGIVMDRKRRKILRTNIIGTLLIIILVFVLLIVGFILLIFLLPSPQPKTGPNVILVVWDGTERVVFKELLDNGNLTFVSSLNIYNMTTNEEYEAVTATRPQHATMFSGYLANITGLWTNDPTKNPSGRSLPVGYSIFERVKQKLPEYYVAGGTGKPLNVGDMLGFMSKGLHYNQHGFDRFDDLGGLIEKYPPLITEDDSIDERFVESVKNTKTPFLYMFHFADPDHIGHNYGVDSTQYRTAIINCDQATSVIYSILKPYNPIIIITGDHGFGKGGDKFGHINDPYTFIASNSKLRNAHEVDVSPTIYNILGIDVSQFTPHLNGTSLIIGSKTPFKLSIVIMHVWPSKSPNDFKGVIVSIEWAKNRNKITVLDARKAIFGRSTL